MVVVDMFDVVDVLYEECYYDCGVYVFEFGVLCSGFVDMMIGEFDVGDDLVFFVLLIFVYFVGLGDFVVFGGGLEEFGECFD